MLQQTQVKTVIPYFKRFIKAFPTVGHLAKAAEDDVLRQWEGLGYYRRARQLHAAARQIMAKYEGQFPREPEMVRALPGIGRYTAGAILSIAYDAREPILEANTARLAARLLRYDGDVSSADGQDLLWGFAAAVLPRRDVGKFNQALMELGSLVCKHKAPDCDACPVRSLCAAATAGTQRKIPRPTKKQVYEEIREAAVAIRHRGRVLLRRCAAEERWAGLWDFPRVAVGDGNGAAFRRQLTLKVQRLTGVTAKPGRRFKTIKHSVTRYRITLDCYEATFISGPDDNTSESELKWLRPAEMDRYPLSTTGRKLARLLVDRAC
jgi:A/G-specific adenine glycosylase